MEIIALTKLISQISLYFAATGFIMRFVSTTAYNEGVVAVASGGVFLQFIIIVAAGICGYVLRNKKYLRFAALILIPPVFMLSKNIVDSIWVVFPCLIVITDVITNKYGCDRKRFIDSFKWAITISAICIFLYYFIPYNDGGTGENGAPLFFMLYIASSVILMRSMRQSNDILNSIGFKISNIVAVTAITAVIIALGYAVRFVSAQFDGSAVAQFIEEFGVWLAAILPNIGKIIITPWGNYNAPSLGWNIAEQESDEYELGHTTFSTINGMSAGVTALLIVIAVLAVVFAVFVLIRKKQSRILQKHTYGRDDKNDGETEVIKSPVITSSNRNTVRRYYRKFMQICRKKELIIEQYNTSLDIRNAALDKFSPEALDELRKVYSNSRYDYATPVDDESVRLAKKAYAAIRKSG